MYNDKTLFTAEPLLNVPATPLYRIAIHGEGTGQIESLHSWLLRLADMQNFAPDTLVRQMLPLRPEVRGEMIRLAWGWDKCNGRMLIGSGRSAEMWTRVLAGSSGCEGLTHTTMHPLRHHLSDDHLLRDELYVCLHCLREDKAALRLTYGRLLWRLSAVTVCPVHGCALVRAQCGRPAGERLAHKYERPKLEGVCGDCGAVGFSCLQTSDSRRPDAARQWRARQCADLLANMAAIAQTEASVVKKAVKDHYRKQPGRQPGLAVRCGVSKSQLSYWLNSPRARLGLPILLDLVASENLSLVHLLQGEVRPALDPCPDTAPVREKRLCREIDHGAVREVMSWAVKEGKSVTEVAADLNVDVTTLRERHPDLYRDLQMRGVTAARARDNLRYKTAVERAQQVALSLLRAGRRLTLQNASAVTHETWYPSNLDAKVLRLFRYHLGEKWLPEPQIRGYLADEFYTMVDAALVPLRSALARP